MLLVASRSTDEEKRDPHYSKDLGLDLWYPIQGVAGCVGDQQHMSSDSAMHFTGLKNGVSSHGGQSPRMFSGETHSVVFRPMRLLAFAFSTFARSCRQSRAPQSRSTSLPHPQERLSPTLSLLVHCNSQQLVCSLHSPCSNLIYLSVCEWIC